MLTDLEPVENFGNYETGALRVNTRPYSDALYQFPGCTEKHSVTYQLDRRYDHFEATVGPSDGSLSGYTVFFSVTVDSREVPEEQVAVGESRMIRVGVSGGYRMTLSVIGARPDGCPGRLTAAWAEPKLSAAS
ncbi:MAG: NPCBM/NEW2 domain-containing protein [Pseudonocardiaceae bacterium]